MPTTPVSDRICANCSYWGRKPENKGQCSRIKNGTTIAHVDGDGKGILVANATFGCTLFEMRAR